MGVLVGVAVARRGRSNGVGVGVGGQREHQRCGRDRTRELTQPLDRVRRQARTEHPQLVGVELGHGQASPFGGEAVLRGGLQAHPQLGDGIGQPSRWPSGRQVLASCRDASNGSAFEQLTRPPEVVVLPVVSAGSDHRQRVRASTWPAWLRS